MGYAVYRDIEGNDRWAGYGVPAECDRRDCTTMIDRGLGYKCESGHEDEDHYDDLPEDDVDPEFEDSGCGFYFCEAHLYNTGEHTEEFVVAKPDSAEWEQFMLTDESWEKWRTENPTTVEKMKERHPDAR